MKTVIAFVAGAAIGAGAAYLYLKPKFEAQAQRDIDQVKEFYGRAKKQEEATEDATPEKENDDLPEPVPAQVNLEKPDVREFAKKLAAESYTNYDQYSSKPEEKRAPIGERPYVISPDEFGELEDYTKISLMYYADGVLCDDMDSPVDNIDEIVGADFADHFGEYEDDSVFVRNDPRRCDYEILRSLKTYTEVIAENPYKAEV